MITLLFFLTVGLALLLLGADLLVRGATSIGLRLGITPLVAGLTIVAFGTSSPELAVGIDSSYRGFGSLAIGSAVGSNICNIALVLGAAALIRPINIQSQLVRLDIPVMILCSLLLIFVLADGVISALDGVALVTGIVAYVFFSIYWARGERKRIQDEFRAVVRDNLLAWWKEILLVAIGMAMLIFGGSILVENAIELAQDLNIAPALVGLTVIAIGTSLPELVTAMMASYRRQGDIAIGNAVGSNIFNILAIVGISALVGPLRMGAIRWTDLAVMLAVSLILIPLVISRRQLARWEGALLLLIYAVYLMLTVQESGL
ncbi:MAG: calcium/sodium antiporter [Gammaproteobacteria bacterium]|nr:calcium/sodium antiporter [Gammaproteobacteria bacterium]MCZ6827519.1 calcium/sodium antiporter [Gammaproteobacteria bacterium]MCZ6911680.1 calcium/sodium antiporter [Pseudomonadota bacterium]